MPIACQFCGKWGADPLGVEPDAPEDPFGELVGWAFPFAAAATSLS
jgi:hypothetical protein